MEQVPISRSGKTFHGDVFQGRPRPLILSPMRRALFDNLHSLSHPGIKASRRPNGISGPIWNATSQRWPVLVTTVSSRKFSGMLRPRCTPFHCLTVVLTYSYWHCWSFTSFQGLYLPIHLHQLVHPLARGDADDRCHCWVLRLSSPVWMGLARWCTDDNQVL